MKKALFIIPAAAMFILAGCQKAQTAAEAAEHQEQTYGDELIYIGIGGFDSPTKVTADLTGIAEVTFSFEEGDEVAFVNMANASDVAILKCIKLVTDETTGKVKAGFTQISGNKVDGEDTQKKYEIYYPKTAADFKFGKPWPIWEENYVLGNLPKEHMIFSKEDAEKYANFTLKNHISVIHFEVKGTAKIKKVEFSEYLESPFGNDYVKRVVLSCGDGVQLNSETSTHFYIDAIMSDDEISKFKLTFYGSSDEKLGEKESTKTTIKKLGVIYDFSHSIVINQPN